MKFKRKIVDDEFLFIVREKLFVISIIEFPLLLFLL